MHAIIERHEVSPSISMHTSQYFHHIQFILYIFRNAHHSFHRKSWQCDISPQSQKNNKLRNPKGTHQAFRCHCSRLTNDKTDLEFSKQNTFCRLTICKISISRSLCFQQKPTFCYCQTLCFLCRHILTRFRFLVLQSKTKIKQTLILRVDSKILSHRLHKSKDLQQ